MAPKIAIVYYSMYGHIKTLAEAEKKGIEAAGGSATLFQLPETLSSEILAKLHAPPKDESIKTLNDPKELESFDGYLFGIPTRYGNMPAQWKTFWDRTGGQWQAGGFFGKYSGLFISTASLGGGQESTAIAMMSTFAHHGIIFVPLGYARTFGELVDLSEVRGGSPWGAGTFAGADGSRQPSAKELALAEAQGKVFFEHLSKVNFAQSGWLSDAKFPKPKGSSFPPNTDSQWTSNLLKHLTDSYCIDKRRVHATGIGTGGGMLSLLACHPTLSTQVASFAAISAAFYNDQAPSSPWAEKNCNPGRRPIPLMEIHGNRDTRWGYWPPGVEGEVQGLGPVGWLDLWKARQVCGEKVGDPKAASFSNATYISKLEHGGMSEGVEFGGGAVRVAYRCHGDDGKEMGKKDPDLRDISTLTLLHYALRDVGYGWPRLDLKAEAKMKVNGHEAYPPGDVHFDATKLALEWFEKHPLPNKEEVERQAKELRDEGYARLRMEGEEAAAAKAMVTDAPKASKEEMKTAMSDEGERSRKTAEGDSERWKDEL
ncbi:hypothetical protein FKW77_010785 [Venturia effusa]|uniref:Flavodoxin-like domain-containing protein n=1 Tax=Venturia effusa TaxID=50376 RepID=A0A517KYF5_9PEZI|nr:hypothetical protein FKW77_010785 [Venturia effusa]